MVVDQAYFDLLAQRAQSEEVTVSVNNDKQIKVIDPMGTTLLIMHD